MIWIIICAILAAAVTGFLAGRWWPARQLLDAEYQFGVTAGQWPDDAGQGCIHTSKTWRDGFTRCYACNPQLVTGDPLDGPDAELIPEAQELAESGYGFGPPPAEFAEPHTASYDDLRALTTDDDEGQAEPADVLPLAESDTGWIRRLDDEAASWRTRIQTDLGLAVDWEPVLT